MERSAGRGLGLMKITIYCIGYLKESYWKAACEEYLKRLKPYADVSIVECPDFPCPEKSSSSEEEAIKKKEGQKVLDKLSPSDYLIALDLHHPECDSPAFATKMEKAFVKGGSKISFVIGGSLGLSDELKKRANEFLTFGEMTFPHSLARVMLLEQIYRGFRILNHEPYHK